MLSLHSTFEVIGETDSVADAVRLTQSLNPDVVFLDVKLRGETGFDYVAQASEPLPHLVFVTAHDRYAVRGFECNALDYLLKPVAEARLAETLQRILHREPLRQRALADDAVFVKIGATARFLPWVEVSHILSEGNYTRVFFDRYPSTLVLRPLHEWMALAPEGLFIQTHRTAIVRRSAIEEVRGGLSGRHEIVLADGQVLPVGRTYWTTLRETITTGQNIV